MAEVYGSDGNRDWSMESLLFELTSVSPGGVRGDSGKMSFLTVYISVYLVSQSVIACQHHSLRCSVSLLLSLGTSCLSQISVVRDIMTKGNLGSLFQCRTKSFSVSWQSLPNNQERLNINYKCPADISGWLLANSSILN